MRDEQRHLAVDDADVVGRIDGDHAGMGPGGADVEARDPRPGIGAAHERDVERVGERDVVDEGALAAEQSRVDCPLDPRSECARGHRLPYPVGMFSAALRTAATMFWYPVQRQRLPESARRMPSSERSGVPPSSNMPTMFMIMPGVQ